jgi:hypothetical protein
VFSPLLLLVAVLYKQMYTEAREAQVREIQELSQAPTVDEFRPTSKSLLELLSTD